MAAHSRILAWEIPRTEEPGGLQSMGSQRNQHDLVTKRQLVPVPPVPRPGRHRTCIPSLAPHHTLMWLWSSHSPTPNPGFLVYGHGFQSLEQRCHRHQCQICGQPEAEKDNIYIINNQITNDANSFQLDGIRGQLTRRVKIESEYMSVKTLSIKNATQNMQGRAWLFPQLSVWQYLRNNPKVQHVKELRNRSDLGCCAQLWRIYWPGYINGNYVTR